MVFYAKDYKSRAELENIVRNRLGLTPDLKPVHVIKGTQEELAKLQLGSRTVFWGIICKIAEEEKSKAEEEKSKLKKPRTTRNQKPDRGTLAPFGIGGKII